jgi:hypothetical protein
MAAVHAPAVRPGLDIALFVRYTFWEVLPGLVSLCRIEHLPSLPTEDFSVLLVT